MPHVNCCCRARASGRASAATAAAAAAAAFAAQPAPAPRPPSTQCDAAVTWHLAPLGALVLFVVSLFLRRRRCQPWRSPMPTR